jgi:hypothetical protein
MEMFKNPPSYVKPAFLFYYSEVSRGENSTESSPGMSAQCNQLTASEKSFLEDLAG